MIGSSHWCLTSLRFWPKREDNPWWENSLRIPVSVTGLSGRRLTIEARLASTEFTRSAAIRSSQWAARPSL